MNLKNTGMPGYFEIAAEGDNFIVAGGQIHQNDSVQTEFMLSNLADVLESLIVFAKDGDMVDRVLDAHGLSRSVEI